MILAVTMGKERLTLRKIRILVIRVFDLSQYISVPTALAPTVAIVYDGGKDMLWREKHGASSCSRKIKAENEMYTVRIILHVSCNLLTFPATDAWKKWYTDITCLITNRSSASPEISWTGQKVEKKNVD